jgi:hypothetical protein
MINKKGSIGSTIFFIVLTIFFIVLTIVLIYVLMRLGILNGIIDMVKGWFGK